MPAVSGPVTSGTGDRVIIGPTLATSGTGDKYTGPTLASSGTGDGITTIIQGAVPDFGSSPPQAAAQNIKREPTLITYQEWQNGGHIIPATGARQDVFATGAAQSDAKLSQIVNLGIFTNGVGPFVVNPNNAPVSSGSTAPVSGGGGGTSGGSGGGGTGFGGGGGLGGQRSRISLN